MDINRFTTKSQEVLRRSQELALSLKQQQVDAAHLMHVLLSQEGSVVPVIMRKLEVDSEKIKDEAAKEVEKYPTTPSANIGQIYITPMLLQVLDEAEKEMFTIGDEFVSTEHLLIALLSIPSPAKKIFEANGVTYEKVLRILSEVRGAQRVDSPEPEGKFQVIEK